jgi:hypothetical protein
MPHLLDVTRTNPRWADLISLASSVARLFAGLSAECHPLPPAPMASAVSCVHLPGSRLMLDSDPI